MAVLSDRPYPATNFLVDLGTGDGPEAGLLEVIFPDATILTIDYRSGNDPTTEPRKIPSLTKYGNITLKRGVTGSLSLYEWWNATRNGDHTARNVIVTLLDEDRKPVLRWTFLHARPASYRFSPLNALCAEALIESLDLSFERMEME
jgi:phage tail-like protein